MSAPAASAVVFDVVRRRARAAVDRMSDSAGGYPCTGHGVAACSAVGAGEPPSRRVIASRPCSRADGGQRGVHGQGLPEGAGPLDDRPGRRCVPAGAQLRRPARWTRWVATPRPPALASRPLLQLTASTIMPCTRTVALRWSAWGAWRTPSRWAARRLLVWARRCAAGTTTAPPHTRCLQAYDEALTGKPDHVEALHNRGVGEQQRAPLRVVSRILLRLLAVWRLGRGSCGPGMQRFDGRGGWHRGCGRNGNGSSGSGGSAVRMVALASACRPRGSCCTAAEKPWVAAHSCPAARGMRSIGRCHAAADAAPLALAGTPRPRQPIERRAQPLAAGVEGRGQPATAVAVVVVSGALSCTPRVASACRRHLRRPSPHPSHEPHALVLLLLRTITIVPS